MRNRATAVSTATNLPKNSDVSAARNIMQNDKNNYGNMEVQRNFFLTVSIILGCSLLFVLMSPSRTCQSTSTTTYLRDATNQGQCKMSFGSYRGHEYTTIKGGTVGKPKCLVESKWLKLSQHSVQFPGSDTIIDDWMWIDYHDRINVLVEDEKKSMEGERQFLVFEQSKYALEGRSSLAIIGGIIEPGEEPEQAARREVDEEMGGLKCNNFHFLGRFRTDVNRGMGWLNSFLATDCRRPGDPSQINHVALQDEIGEPDTERQDLKRITLSRLKEAAMNGEFLEVQWSATVAFALLHPEMT